MKVPPSSSRRLLLFLDGRSARLRADGTRSIQSRTFCLNAKVQIWWTMQLWSQAAALPFAVDFSAPTLSEKQMTFCCCNCDLNVDNATRIAMISLARKNNANAACLCGAGEEARPHQGHYLIVPSLFQTREPSLRWPPYCVK